MQWMRFNLQSLIIILTAVLSIEIFAQSKCAELFKPVSPQIKSTSAPVLKTLFEDLKNEVSRIFERSDLTAAAKAKLSFEIYLDLRLSTFTAQEQQSIRKFLDKKFEYVVHRRPDITTTGILDCSYSPGGISIKIPITIAGTILDYAIRAHEIEHAIQALEPIRPTYGSMHPKHFAELFERELGAMAAESLLLLAVPRSEIETLRTLLSTEKLPEIDRKILSNLLKSAWESENPEAYVKSQWKQGRYSHWTFLRKQLDLYIGAGALAGLGYWVTTLFTGI